MLPTDLTSERTYIKRPNFLINALFYCCSRSCHSSISVVHFMMLSIARLFSVEL
jgi:hypothetical protein